MKVDIDRSLLKSLLIMGSVVEARDTYTGGHLWRVAKFSRMLGEKTGLSKNDSILIRIGGFLHDIGKIGVPDAVLLKPGRLDEREFDIIKTHPVVGVNLIREHPLAVISQDAIWHHHEKYNGTGYPDGIAADNINILTRIVSVCDAFDAMTSVRPYRNAMPAENALMILKDEMDRQFDGKLVSAFMEIDKEGLMRVIGHSDEGVPLVKCSQCGPVITVTRNAKEGDEGVCPVCGAKHVLHKQGNTFVAAPADGKGAPDELTPAAAIEPIEAFIEEVPDSLQVEY